MNESIGLRALYLGIGAGVLGLDHWSKQWATDRLQLGPPIDVIGGCLRLIYAENPGIAFSLFDSGADTTRWVLAAFASIAAIVVVVMALRTDLKEWRVQITYAFLFAGIVGNLVDRMRSGRVVDFIDAYVGTHHWPTFNVADSAITVGACLLAIELLRSPAKPAEEGG